MCLFDNTELTYVCEIENLYKYYSSVNRLKLRLIIDQNQV